MFFERAALIQPAEVKWLLMVASCYRRAANYQRALAKYKEIHIKFPDNVECESSSSASALSWLLADRWAWWSRAVGLTLRCGPVWEVWSCLSQEVRWSRAFEGGPLCGRMHRARRAQTIYVCAGPDTRRLEAWR